MTVLDACLFAGEQKMLELRMRTLAETVDAFLVVACTLTHQGEPARCDEIADAYTAARDATGVASDRARLWWVAPDTSIQRGYRTHLRPAGERGPVLSPWFQDIEHKHRDACRDAALSWTTDRDAIVMVSDVDEIPDVETVRTLPELMRMKDGWVTCEMRMHSTSLGLLHPVQPWFGTCVSRLRDLEPQNMRDARTTVGTEQQSIDVVGPPSRSVHLSWFGTDSERARKLETFSHAEIYLRGDDPADWRAAGTHANGEVLQPVEFDTLPWPAPLVDGTFEIPEEWK